MDATEDEPTSFIYLSPDALSNPSKLLVLIQGSGVVRAGQWARRLIINQDLDSGTQIPFIDKALEVGVKITCRPLKTTHWPFFFSFLVFQSLWIFKVQA